MKNYDITRKRFFSGFDGATCKASPRIASDGESTFLLYHFISLGGSDVCIGNYVTRTADGESFSEPKFLAGLDNIYKGEERIKPDSDLFYNKKYGKWLGFGRTTHYLSDKHPVLLGEDKPTGGVTVNGDPLFFNFDPEKQDFYNMQKLDFPFEYLCATPFSSLELESGEMLVCFYYNTPSKPGFFDTQVLKYDVSGEVPRFIEAGNILSRTDIERGLTEPSITYFGGKYYMTIRSNELALWATSDDGLNYTEPKPWVFEDGALLGSVNTQQHWVNAGDALYLTYTRETPYNHHVVRNRAPIFMTRFDTERGCLIRDEEMPLVPELGARLGNFRILNVSKKEKWLAVCEWMQPIGCEKYGSDNSIWLVKMFFD